jgi:hypothetical protein
VAYLLGVNDNENLASKQSTLTKKKLFFEKICESLFNFVFLAKAQ